MREKRKLIVFMGDFVWWLFFFDTPGHDEEHEAILDPMCDSFVPFAFCYQFFSSRIGSALAKASNRLQPPGFRIIFLACERSPSRHRVRIYIHALCLPRDDHEAESSTFRIRSEAASSYELNINVI